MKICSFQEFSLSTSGKYVIAAGGSAGSFSNLNVVELFNMDTLIWRKIQSMNQQRSRFGGAVIMNSLSDFQFVVSDDETTERYSFSKNEWDYLDNPFCLRNARQSSAFARVAIHNWEVYFTNDCYIYHRTVNIKDKLHDLVRYAAERNLLR